MIDPKTAAPKAPPIKRKSVRNWLNGVVTDNDDARTPVEGLRGSANVILQQDGVVTPRPSLALYGPQPVGTILGETFEFKNNSTGEYWMINLQKVSSTTSAYIARGQDTSWTICTGKTYDNSSMGHFKQIQDKVLIMNGTDSLSYLNVPTSAVVPFSAILAPSAPTVVNNGSSDLTTATTPFSITYRVTANSTVGETEASASTARTVNTDRDLWNPTTQSLKITWSAVTGAQSYNVYMGVVGLFEYKIATGINGLQFIDDGTFQQDIQTLYPTTNSTAGAKATRGEVINGRVFLVGDKDQPFYVRNGGDPGAELDFSPSHGGGFSLVGNGTKEKPTVVKSFRDGRGNSQITVLCQGSNGNGKRYLLTPSTLDFAGSTISFFEVTEDNGQDGTESPDGVVLYNDSLWYPSRDGFKTTGTKPQLQNILSTNRVSNTIQRDIKNLNSSAMGTCVGVGFEGRLYWALPVGTSANNEIWVLDLDRKGAWMKPWSVSADWMWLYNDNNGLTHFLITQNNQIMEFTYSQLTSDNGTAFATIGNSGIIKFSDDGREWAKVIQVVFTMLRPQGSINFTIAGKTEDASLATVGSEIFSTESTIAGWSEVAWGERGWSEVITVPVAFGDASYDVVVEVDEELQYLQYGWNTTEVGANYALSDVILEYVEIGIKDLT